MKTLKITLLFLVSLFSADNLAAQRIVDTVSPPAYEPTREQRIWTEGAKRNERIFGGKDENGMIKQPPPEISVYEPFEGSRKKERERIKEAKAVALADIEEINKKLTAPSEYLNKFPEYINGKTKGIFRIFPDKGCGKGKIVEVSELERCGHLPQVLGFGSKISFRLSAVPESAPESVSFLFAFPDIEFTASNSLKAGNPLMETLITELGNLNLENIDSKSESIKFLTNWKKGKKRKDITAARKSIEKGISANGYVYSSNVPVKLNSVYALRSIFYSQSEYKTYWNTDLLVAFKIVGQEKDGSIIIIWKQLHKKDAPLIVS